MMERKNEQLRTKTQVKKIIIEQKSSIENNQMDRETYLEWTATD